VSDILDQLRTKAAQCSQATPFVRVTGDLLNDAADEIAALRKREDERLKAMLFDQPRRPAE
jgi:hypothetical protein